MNKKPTIHNVMILDSSSSMWGEKYNSAIKGLNEEILEMRKEEGVNYTVTLVEFSSDVYEHCFMKPLAEVDEFGGRGANGSTRLYQTVGETLEKVALRLPKGDHVLVKIFTDGQENASSGRFADAKEVQKLITILEKANFTVTFEGTEFDAETAVQKLGIKKENVLTHANTAQSIYANSKTRGMQSKMYSMAVMDGSIQSQDFGFYASNGSVSETPKDMGDIMQNLDKNRESEENKI